MTTVDVSGAVLRWAVERSPRPAAVERRFPRFREWESGERHPTLRQLEQLARATATPLGFFFLAEPPEERLPIPHFRTVKDEPVHRPSPDLLETVYTMQRRQEWLREYLVEQGQGPLQFVGSFSPREEPEAVARDIRRRLGFEDGWASKQPSWTAALGEFRNRIAEAGTIVAVSGIVGNNTRRKLDPREFRGFVLVDAYVPLVFVNGADARAAQMFTLAHELAHVWLGISAAFDLRDLQPAADETEQVCNYTAAELLVPETELRELWPRVRRDPEPYQSIAMHFKVSVLVAARRALDLGFVSTAQFLRFYRDYLEDERRRGVIRGEGGNFYATQNLRLGRPFAEAVVRAAREGALLYRDAYQLTGLHGRTFERYADRLMGEA